ncbi:MAG: hypothetical protein HYY84_19105 [Deltaproteobacteria bacterium]|nr:hypothetical protein [Deltaproteobacteria bacterium]
MDAKLTCAAVAALGVCVGCAVAQNKAGKGDDGLDKILLSREYVDGPLHGAAHYWLVFAALRTPLREGADGNNRVAVRPYGFQETHNAMLGLLAIREKDRGKPGFVAEPLLDNLAKAQAAGFFTELLIRTFAAPGWTIPGKTVFNVRLEAFNKWVAANLKQREYKIPVWTRREKVASRALGAVRTPIVFKGRASCDSVMKSVLPAIQRWEDLAASLKERPISADNRRGFFDALTLLRRNAKLVGHSVVWVSSDVHRLYYIAGYCLARRTDEPISVSAASHFQKAISVNPVSSQSRLAYVHALNLARRFDESLRENLAAMEIHTVERCVRLNLRRQRASAYAGLGDEVQVLASVKLALDENPTLSITAFSRNQKTLDNLGQVFRKARVNLKNFETTVVTDLPAGQLQFTWKTMGDCRWVDAE